MIALDLAVPMTLRYCVQSVLEGIDDHGGHAPQRIKMTQAQWDSLMLRCDPEVGRTFCGVPVQIVEPDAALPFVMVWAPKEMT